MSINRWLDKEKNIIHSHTMEYDSAIKIMKSCHLSNINGHRGHYSNRNKSDRQRQILYVITYTESKIYKKVVNII